jgi:hypothetical protein
MVWKEGVRSILGLCVLGFMLPAETRAEDIQALEQWPLSATSATTLALKALPDKPPAAALVEPGVVDLASRSQTVLALPANPDVTVETRGLRRAPGSTGLTKEESQARSAVSVSASTPVLTAKQTNERLGGTDLAVWLDQAAPAQGVQPVQDDVGAPRPSSTSSRDLQPAALSPGSLDLTSVSPNELPDIAQSTSPQAQSDQWHFLLVPYVYLPFSISGTATYEDSENFRNNFAGNFDGSQDFEFDSGDITTALKNSLNFAFLGEFEAWTPNYQLGILANFDYLSLSDDDTLNRSVRRPGFANFVPTEIDTSVDTQVWNVDLAASYRFYDPAQANPQGLNTEYDLGPFVFDVLGGLKITSINTDLDLSTNLGGEGEFSTNDTLISPLLGGRFRWNATPELAVLVSGSVSGFGISGLTQYAVQGGVSWMFSGNTSLGLGYRFAALDYNADSNELDLEVDQHGPYLNFGFRF